MKEIIYDNAIFYLNDDDEIYSKLKDNKIFNDHKKIDNSIRIMVWKIDKYKNENEKINELLKCVEPDICLIFGYLEHSKIINFTIYKKNGFECYILSNNSWTINKIKNVDVKNIFKNILFEYDNKLNYFHMNKKIIVWENELNKNDFKNVIDNFQKKSSFLKEHTDVYVYKNFKH